MTYEKVIEMLDNLGADVEYFEDDGTIFVTLQNEDGHFNYREYDNKQAVNNFLQTLKENCTHYDDDYFRTYDFEGFDVFCSTLALESIGWWEGDKDYDY